MKNIKNIFLSAVGLLIGFSSCSDEFLKDKKDYNRMTTIDVYSDRQQATAVFATIYKQILSRYNSPLCGSDPLMRQDRSKHLLGRNDGLEKCKLYRTNYKECESGKSYKQSSLLE